MDYPEIIIWFKRILAAEDFQIDKEEIMQQEKQFRLHKLNQQKAENPGKTLILQSEYEKEIKELQNKLFPPSEQQETTKP